MMQDDQAEIARRQREAEALREGADDPVTSGLRDELKFILIVGVGIGLAFGWALANAFLFDGPGILNYGGVALGSGAAVLLLRRWDLHWGTGRVAGPITIGLVVPIVGFNALIVDTGGLSQDEVELFNCLTVRQRAWSGATTVRRSMVSLR